MTERGAPSKAELLARLTASRDHVVATVRALPAEALERGRYENGWNGRQILAHVASIAWTLRDRALSRADRWQVSATGTGRRGRRAAPVPTRGDGDARPCSGAGAGRAGGSSGPDAGGVSRGLSPTGPIHGDRLLDLCPSGRTVRLRGPVGSPDPLLGDPGRAHGVVGRRSVPDSRDGAPLQRARLPRNPGSAPNALGLRGGPRTSRRSPAQSRAPLSSSARSSRRRSRAAAPGRGGRSRGSWLPAGVPA